MKLFKLIGLGALLAAFNVNAATTSLTLPVGTFTNFVGIYGPVKLTAITVSATNTAQIKLIDTYTNWIYYTNSAYTNVLTYLTNQVTSYTNYYGVTTLTTNYNLVDSTSVFNGSTNLFNVPVAVNIATNGGTWNAPMVNYYFMNGLWATNAGPNPVSVTFTYQQ